MATVDIYLPIESTTEWILALSIPCKDIERLTPRPLKWLRFATFAVCGTKGHLSTTQGGEMVDYENVSFDNLADRYYYNPDGAYHLVDIQAFNDKCTSSVATRRSSNFRRAICERDVSCVITGMGHERCDATHIIPRSKGNNYISYVVRDRSSLYEQLQFSLEDDVNIDHVENGILLRRDLHDSFDAAEIVFLKTPNFAMVPADVPRIEQGPIPDNRTTLQYMKPPLGRSPVPPWDVQADWHDEAHTPPSILLDFMYGAAVVRRWKCDRLCDMLEKRFNADFNKVVAEIPKPPTPKDIESEVEPDDPGDPYWVPWKGNQKGRKTFSSDASAGLLDAMDDVLVLSMLVKGITPRSMAAEWEKRNQERERRCQEHSREKVQQWLKLDAPG